MESTQIVYMLIGNLVSQLPQMIAIIVGIIIAFMKLSKHPKASKFALAGLGILFFSNLLSLGFSVVRVQLPSLLDGNYQLAGYIYAGINVFFSLVWTLALGLLIFAIWTGREEK